MFFRLAIAMLVSAAAAAAQQPKPNAPNPSPSPPTGTVTGHITASDTQRPARFAQVMLLWKKPKSDNVEEDDEEKLPSRPELIEGRSLLDGSFNIVNVPEGDYYIFGQMAGYALPFKRLTKTEEDDDDDTNMARVMANVPTIHVTADRTIIKDIAIERGAAINGHVAFDDGSPAVSMKLVLEAENGDDALEASLPGAYQVAAMVTRVFATDDKGGFRMVGIPPGKYRIFVTIAAEESRQWGGGATMWAGTVPGQQLRVYAPGKFRKSEAQVIEVKNAEEVPDIEIKIALDSMHTVSGRVISGEDGHAPNHSIVMLVDPAGEIPNRELRVNTQGEFHVRYVPSGSYDLLIRGRDSVLSMGGRFPWKIAKDYQQVKIPVLVGEHDVKVDDILVVAQKKQASASEP